MARKAATRLNMNGFNALRRNLPGKIQVAMLAAAHQIKEEAKSLAPTDTGVLTESIHVTTKTFSEYPMAKASATAKHNAAKAAGRTPKGRFFSKKRDIAFFEEVRPATVNEVFVVVGAQHGFIREYGGAKQGATPFLTPAVENNIAAYQKALEEAITESAGTGIATVVNRKV